MLLDLPWYLSPVSPGACDDAGAYDCFAHHMLSRGPTSLLLDSRAAHCLRSSPSVGRRDLGVHVHTKSVAPVGVFAQRGSGGGSMGFFGEPGLADQRKARGISARHRTD